MALDQVPSSGAALENQNDTRNQFVGELFSPHHNSQIAVFAMNQLDAQTQQALASSTGPAVIEFIDRNDSSAECLQAPSAFAQAATQLEGQVTFIGAYDDQQSPQMIAQDRVAVCPTYFFVFDRQNPDQMVAKRIWGYLNSDQLESVSNEMWNVNPAK